MLWPLLYRTKHFPTGRTGRKGAQKRGGISSSIGVGVWRKAPEALPDSNTTLDTFQSSIITHGFLDPSAFPDWKRGKTPTSKTRFNEDFTKDPGLLCYPSGPTARPPYTIALYGIAIPQRPSFFRYRKVSRYISSPPKFALSQPHPKGPKIKKIQDRPPGLKFSSETENFNPAAHQNPIFCGEF